MSPTYAHSALAITAAAAGTAAIMLPFTWSTSPLDALTDGFYWHLGIPFFLTLPIAAASVQWLRTGAMRRLERRIGYAAGAAAALTTVSFFVRGLVRSVPEEAKEWASLLIACAVLLAGGLLLAGSVRRPDFRPILSMQIAYLGNCTFCLVAFAGEWQSGAFFALVAAIAYVWQVDLASPWRWSRSAARLRMRTTSLGRVSVNGCRSSGDHGSLG